MQNPIRILFTLGMASLLISCDSGSTPDETGSSGTTSVVASYASIQEKVFNVSCAVSGCHAGTSAKNDLRLDSNSSYLNLVKVPSKDNPAINRVEPNKPDSSYLIQKLEGTQATGVKMPKDQAALPTATINAIREWIDNGALVPTLASIQENIFTPSCLGSGCHNSNDLSSKLNLEDGSSYTMLVGKNSDTDISLTRVVAGSSGSSFLIKKLEGSLTATQGERMPKNGPYLSQEQINTIKLWIDNGALQ